MDRKGEDVQDGGLPEQGDIKLSGSDSASSLDGHGPGRETECCRWARHVGWAGHYYLEAISVCTFSWSQ